MKKAAARRLFFGIVALVCVVVGTLAVLLVDEGDVGFNTVISYAASPVIIPIVAEFLALAFLIISFFIPKDIGRARRLLRFTALGLVIGLFGFYFIIPRIPIDIEANHPDPGWDDGEVVHILPAVNTDRILIKTSLVRSVKQPFVEYTVEDSSVGSTGSTPADPDRADRAAQAVAGTVPGKMTDTEGAHWCFSITGLASDTSYRLELVDSHGNTLCDPWEVRTFPLPQDQPERVRILVFTCPGGHDATRTWFGFGQIPLRIRQRLLNRALEFEPDILVSLGDQIYYDLTYGVSAKVMGDSRRARHLNGEFDKELPVLGTRNEHVLKNAVGPQIAYLYGTACRSLPGFFILDDHDYFVNDDAREEDEWQLQLLLAWLNPYVEQCVTLPPEGFLLELARTTQNLYLPEFLPDATRPEGLPGVSDRNPSINETYGSLRYGDLLEGVFFELRRFLTLDGKDAVFLPPETEQWIRDRMGAEAAQYFVCFSALSCGWSCGKWLSWYPDVKTKREEGVELSMEEKKYLWQEGWFHQHQRLLQSADAMRETVPLFVCGDIHHQSAGRIMQSGDLDFSDQPIASIHPGALSVDKGGYPSKGIRGIKATPPTLLDVQEELPSFEKAGFVIMDVTREKITARFFGWRNGTDPVEEIETLQPHFVFEVPARR
jgi:hypothetical protein